MQSEGLTDAAPDNLIITYGSAQAMHLAAQVFIDREDHAFIINTQFLPITRYTTPTNNSCLSTSNPGGKSVIFLSPALMRSTALSYNYLYLY
jgi:aspartate/methionine/tyrosine aminotransferase